MRYRVEAQVLIVRHIEAESEDEACKKMDERLQDKEYRDLDWCIFAYKNTEKLVLKDWEMIKGINIIDYDGFDRKDEKLMERLFTEEEFDKGAVGCTLRYLR